MLGVFTMAKEKNSLVTCIKNIVLATLASFGVFIAVAAVLAAVLNEIENEIIRDCIAYAITMAIYAALFYRFHMYPRISTYVSQGDEFDGKEELLGFLRADGRLILIIYGIATVATEISCFIFPSPTPNPVATACLFAMGPFSVLIPVPVLRSIVCFVYASAVVCGLTLLRSHKIYKDDLVAEARRREK